ncbi:ornithine cyclodeaminase family protein [Chromobacterium violaceum]|uniref:Ornithine cyclodeaminase n=1 Tax=Chromobacterium violaceum (strain ATCC 12472 / DSM 30191 / JCM 1249 / CCUG 213 / NBRC 12614 / NCIMB 9131 / NCTC 9757 / MK) TaxID=243365 RepID=Q7NT16_CHRVO|nr:ornithine cyclodeaminase family protein [Chromobacterium violaceum]AAQ60913.1 ornithine cyclodeaminase [Chromobacterium violaceum ATCC 12472]SUX39381.1 ornithine cyclodeaminase [Chromobacterium violaceum]
MKLLDKNAIIARFDADHALARVKAGFIAYSRGQVQSAPVQNFHFAGANGDCCVKSAHIAGEEALVVKISTGFYDNPSRGLPSNDGLVLALSATDGRVLALLQDQGWLTTMRTALAGRLVAGLLAPSRVEAIGLLGAGEQARAQLEQLRAVTDCREVRVWSRQPEQAAAFCAFAAQLGFRALAAADPRAVAAEANLIVTATPSRGPLLQRGWIRPGTHITALGADGPGKQELDPAIAADANVVVADSLAQCAAYGELSHAVKAGLLAPSRIVELGDALASGVRLRQNDEQITLADLTGIAAQDAAIAASVLAPGG